MSEYESDNRKAILWVTPELISSIILSWRSQTKICLPVCDEVPRDASVHHVFYDHERCAFAVVLKHQSFGLVGEGGLLPSLNGGTMELYSFETEEDGKDVSVIGQDADFIKMIRQR